MLVPEEVTYEYDEWDRLTKVTRDGSVVEYLYNGDNLLVERKENNVTTRYYYDGNHIVAEGIVQSNGTVTETASYVYGNDLILREDATQTKSYYLKNGHGDVVSLRNASGTILNKYEYDIWGNTIVKTGTTPNLFRYSGEYWDETAGLQYLRARWYDPSMGRFINEDTYEGELANPLSLNLYTYVHNNPLIYVDPTGHLTFKAAWYISRGSQDYLLNTAIDGVEALFSASTYKAVWNLSKEIYNGNISISDIGVVIGENLSEPFMYLAEHGDYVLNGKPTKDEAYAFGQNYAKALSVMQAAFTTGITLTPKIASAFKNSISLLNSFKKIKANVSDLVKNPLDEFDYNRGNYNAEALKSAREYIHQNGTISSPILVRILDDGTMQIVDGHHRWWAAQQAGLRQVPIKVER